MGRFCLFACTGLTGRFRRGHSFFYSLASLLKLIRSEKGNVLISEKFLYDEEQKQFSKQNVGSANERKSKEKSKNSASKRHWWSVSGLNRTSLHACGSIWNKSKLRHEIFLFSLQFSATLINLAQNGQMLHDNVWAMKLIAALLLTFTSHIRPVPSPQGVLAC